MKLKASNPMFSSLPSAAFSQPFFFGSGIPGDMSGLPGVFFSPDDDGGGSGDGAGGAGGGDNGGGAGGSGGGTDNTDLANDPTKLFTPEQQAVFNKAMAKQKRDADEAIKVATAKAEDAARQKITAETQKAEKAAETKRNAEQGKWEEVAKTRGEEIATKDAEITTLKAQAELATRLVDLQNQQIDAQVKDFHSEVKSLDPGPSDIEARMKWLPVGQKIQARYDVLAKNYDTDLGKGSGGGRGASQFDRIRAEEKALQDKNSSQTKSLEQRLGRAGAS